MASPRGGSSEAYEPGLYSQADLNQALPHSEPRVFFTPSSSGPAVDISILCLFLSWAPLQVLPWTSLRLGGPHDIVLGVLTPPALFSDPYSQLCKLERGHLGSRLHLCPVFSSSSSFSSFFFLLTLGAFSSKKIPQSSFHLCASSTGESRGGQQDRLLLGWSISELPHTSVRRAHTAQL